MFPAQDIFISQVPFTLKTHNPEKVTKKFRIQRLLQVSRGNQTLPVFLQVLFEMGLFLVALFKQVCQSCEDNNLPLPFIPKTEEPEKLQWRLIRLLTIPFVTFLDSIVFSS
jgi:hypothetical protein